MFRTYDDPAPGWGKSIIGLPEMYTYVGTDYRGQPVEPFFVPANQVAGFPGGRVGEYNNRSNSVLPNSYHTEQTSIETNWDISDAMSLQFLTAVTAQDSDSVIDWDNSQYDLVLDMNRSELDVFSQEIQLTGGGDRIEWLAGVYYWDQKTVSRNGRWQVNEFQLGLMNPQNVFNNAVCNPTAPPAAGTAGLTIEPLPNGTIRTIPGVVDSTGRTLGGTLVADNPATADREDLFDGNATTPGIQPVPNPRTPGQDYLANGLGAWQTCQQVYAAAIPGAFDAFSVRAGRLGGVRRGEHPSRRLLGPDPRCASA